MKFLAFIFLFLSISAYSDSIVEKSQKDDLLYSEEDDPYMKKAMRTANATLNSFIKLYKNPKPGQDSFAVKVGVSDGEETEFFWLNELSFPEAGAFSGKINNTPRVVKTVTFGQVYEFNREEVVDWTYIENGKMKGNYTACALLVYEPKEEQKKFMEYYGLECEI